MTGIDWPEQAACRGLTVTRALCVRCPVARECLYESLVNREPVGLWGGLDEWERRRLLRRCGWDADRPFAAVTE